MRVVRRIGAIVASLTIVAVALVAPAPAPSAEAAPSAQAITAADWNPGNIISDPLFYDDQAMSEAEIQAFLNGKVGACTNSLCIKNLRVAVEGRAAYYSPDTGALVCRAFEGGILSAAAIIFRAQVACSISAKVILVTLQKEQGLVTKAAPTQTAVDRAMGMACPDTAPCAAYALGFGNQVYLGAKQLMTYKAGRFSKQPGVQYIQYHPNSACGGTTLNVQNYATAALYAYTPYQPNPAALANLEGVGDGCSSYGNRNFWRYYNAWFGTTQGYPTASTDWGPTVVARVPNGDLWLYPGNGRGSWGTPTQLTTGLAGMPFVFGGGDFDGDGHRDVLAIDQAGTLWIYPLDGRAGVLPRVKVSDGWSAMTAVFSPGDFTGDRIPDVMSRDAAGGLWLHPGTGKGGLRPAVQIGWGWNGLNSLMGVGDFSGDGYADVLGRDAAGDLMLYTGNGRGGWIGGVRIGIGWGGFSRILSPGDFDGDGRNDLLAVTTTGAGLYLYRGSGYGGWLGGSQIGSNWGGFDALVGPGALAGNPYVEPAGSGDLDRDGARDILATSGDGLYLYSGNGIGNLKSAKQVASSWSGRNLTFGAGDFDGDGVADIISRGSDGNLLLHSAAADGTVSTGRVVGMGWSGFDVIFNAGDRNGDKTSDIIARSTDGALWLYPTDGRGGWGTAKRVGQGWNGFNTVFSVGDFDGNGTPDLMARDAPGRLYLYPGDPNGSWLDPVQIGQGWGGFTALFSPGDFTGDGAPDVVARAADGGLWLYPGNGRGGWGVPRQIGWGWGGLSWVG